MSDQLQQAKDRRNQLRSELALIEQYIDLHTRIFGDEQTANPQHENVTETHKQARRQNDPKAIADTTNEILNAANRPMPRGRLIAALKERGIEIQSKDASKYLGTIMWRNSDRFVNIEGEGYWPKDRVLPSDTDSKQSLFQ